MMIALKLMADWTGAESWDDGRIWKSSTWERHHSWGVIFEAGEDL